MEMIEKLSFIYSKDINIPPKAFQYINIIILIRNIHILGTLNS